jgi:hypothetical protein
VWTLPTGSIVPRNRQSPKPGVVHDHVGLGQHQIAAVTRTVIGIGARHVQDTGTTQRGETVSGSSCGGEFGSGGGSTKMISDGCPCADGKVLIKSIGENLLPTAQACRLWRPGPPVAAPDTGNRHIDLLCYLIPGQPLVTELEDLLGGSWMRGSATTHSDSGAT